MNLRSIRLIVPAAVVFALAGCASTPSESSESSASSGVSVAPSPDGGTSRVTSDSTVSASPDRTVEKVSSSSPATVAPDEPRSSWRAEREKRAASASAGGGGSAGSSDSARLAEQLGEATRELATLRAANAKMRAERASPPKPAAASFKPDPTDEKLSSSLKSYVSFKEEVANIFSEIDRVKQENAGLSSSLKAAVEQADQARATMARLEKEMRAEQRSRQEAEKTVAELREQLRAVARAVSAAGLSVDKLTTNAESAGKRD